MHIELSAVRYRPHLSQRRACSTNESTKLNTVVQETNFMEVFLDNYWMEEQQNVPIFEADCYKEGPLMTKRV